MKKIISVSLISSMFLMATSPIHDMMDNRIKGQSYSGSLEDHKASEDGLGIIPLNGYSAPRDIANELIVQKVLNNINKSETDITKRVNIKDNLTNGLVGTVSDLNIVNNVLSSSVDNSNNNLTLENDNIVLRWDNTTTVGVDIWGYDPKLYVFGLINDDFVKPSSSITFCSGLTGDKIGDKYYTKLTVSGSQFATLSGFCGWGIFKLNTPIK